MSAEVVSAGASDESELALEQWARLSDALFGGLVHALNNRITALGVGAELSALGDPDAFAQGALAAEVSRLQRIGALMALLPQRGREPAALELAPVLQDVLALYAHLPRAHGVHVHAALASDLEPVRAPRWALLRALLVLADAAAADAERRGATTATLSVASDAHAVRVAIEARDGAGHYAAVAAALCCGDLTHAGDAVVLTLPSLTAVRRRERVVR